MPFIKVLILFLSASFVCQQAQAGNIDPDLPAINYVSYSAPDLLNPGQLLTISGQLRMPASADDSGDIPAVVIMHGSAGVDSRGALYARELNLAGIATLEVDMWGARGLSGGGNRPPLPTVTVPDAFGALQYLAQMPGIDGSRVGLLGFSWGGVVSMLSANQLYADGFGGGLQFAAHVAHYPVCWGYNVGIPGIVFDVLTGAPVLIQIGDKDDYDEGGAVCENLASAHDEVSVIVYPNAHHAWDRLQPALTVNDPFSHLGAGGEVNIVPNPGKARQSTRNAVQFFASELGLNP